MLTTLLFYHWHVCSHDVAYTENGIKKWLRVLDEEVQVVGFIIQLKHSFATYHLKRCRWDS